MNSKESRRLWVFLILVLLVVMLTACQSAPPLPSSTSQASTASVPIPIDETKATELMYTLLQGPLTAIQTAIERILAAGDRRFIPVFIELLRGFELGLLRYFRTADLLNTLEALSGVSLGLNWAAWAEWYGPTDFTPPAGFLGWKGHILSRIDARFAEFLQDDYPSRIRSEEIVWGGVQVDGIPALDNPNMIEAAEADYLEPHDAVFGVYINGEARAYPLRIMDWHEMANDIVGGIPVSLAYCTLCGSAIAFDGRASDGNAYTFGSSGLLFRSNKLMYDRQTRTLWNQLSGEPVLGPLADTTIQLKLLPVVLARWDDWRMRHPDTLVLDTDTGFRRNYTTGAAYGDYFSSSETMFPVWQRRDTLEAKAHIYGLRIDGIPKAYPLKTLSEAHVVNDLLGDTPVVLITTRGEINLDGVNKRVGAVQYAAGGEVRAYERGDKTFSQGVEANTVLDATGRPWRVSEDALIGPEGETVARIAGHLAYWFGWFALFPNTLVYGQ